jgi:hypothetical protein
MVWQLLKLQKTLPMLNYGFSNATFEPPIHAFTLGGVPCESCNVSNKRFNNWRLDYPLENWLDDITPI